MDSNSEYHDGTDTGATDAADTEAAPLLGAQPRRPSHRPTLSVASVPSLKSVHVPKAHKGSTIVGLLCVIIFIGSCSGGFTEIPVVRIIEDIICRDYYSRNGALTTGDQIDEKMCKGDAIQTDVQDIVSVTNMLTSLMGFLSAFPWGLVADRLGRKPVVVFALLGLALGYLIQLTVLYFHDVFPIRLVWLSAASVTVGGGNAVLAAIVLSIVTDATTDKDRAIAYMRIHVFSMCGNLLSPSLSALLMGRAGPWACIWLGIALLILTAIMFVFVPETLRYLHDRETEADEAETPNMKSRIIHAFSRFKESISIIKSPSLLFLILSLFAARAIDYSMLQFMAQFVSKRYGIKLSQTGYIQTVYGACHLVMAFVVLPWLSKVLVRSTTPARLRSKDEHHRDLTLARSFYGVQVVSSFILGLARALPGFVFGLVVMALGSASTSLTRSLMSLYVDPEHTSRLFTLVAMVEVLGSAYSPPFMARLFKLGLRLSGGWIGLPYYGLALMLMISAILLTAVRLPKASIYTATLSETHDEPE